MIFECMSCPIHGDGRTPLLHGRAYDESCRDTHAYWLNIPGDQRSSLDSDAPYVKNTDTAAPD